MGEVSPLGRRIKLLRERRGLSMGELARLAKVTRPSISYLESGRQGSMNSDGLARVARVLGVTADSLLYGDVLEENEPKYAAALA
jgi:XRE family transcriptional regulator, master regulator for biofilm formation